MRLLFLGTPIIATQYLDFLSSLNNHTIVGIVTQPDKNVGRGLVLTAPPVKERALALELTNILQPNKIREENFLAAVRELNPDLAVVVAYGKILPKAFLELPKLGVINIHFSLLPRWRGASPVEHALLHGDDKTGVTIFWLDEGMDTGPILMQDALSIDLKETTPSLFNKLIPLGQKLLAESLNLISKNQAPKNSQNNSLAVNAPKLTKEMGLIEWSHGAQEIDRQIRALSVWPTAYTFFKDRPIQILKASPRPQEKLAPQKPVSGSIAGFERGVGFFVKCGIGELLVEELRPQGGRQMSAWAFLQGLPKPHDQIVFGGIK